MASVKEMRTKDGRRFYKISVSRGYGKTAYSMRWYPPETYSQRSIERELRKVTAEFERACAAGEVLSRSERKAKEAAEAEAARIEAERAAAEAAKLKTVRQYADSVFMPAKEITFSGNARSNYRQFLNKHIYPAIGDFYLADVTPAMISKLLLDFQKSGYSHASVIKLFNILNGIFKAAYRGDMIPKNPMDKVDRPTQSKESASADDSGKAFTVEEVRYILSCLENEPLKWQVYCSKKFV